MATHSRILAWEIPWTGQPGGLRSMGLQESDTTQRLSTYTLINILLRTHVPTFVGKKQSLQQPGREAGSIKGALGICFSRALYFISDSQ